MNEHLADYIGCACEVKTMENDLLVVGKIRAVLDDDNGQAIEITSYDGEEMPVMAYGVPVKVNLYSSKHGYLGLGGTVYITHESFWRINGIKTLGQVERRGYFRVKVRTKAIAFGPDITNTLREFPCAVTSISLSGLLFSVREEECFFRVGTELEIRGLTLDEEREAFDVRCKVCRSDDNRILGKVFGCEFINMDAKQTDRLCQEIFAKQRADIQRRRSRI